MIIPTTTLMKCTNAHTQGFLIHMLWLSLDLSSTGSQPVNGASNSIKARWKVPTEWPGMYKYLGSFLFSVWCGQGLLLIMETWEHWQAPGQPNCLLSCEAFCDAHMLRTFIDTEIVKILKLFFWQEYIPEELVWRHNCVRTLLPGDQARLKLAGNYILSSWEISVKWNFFVILYEDECWNLKEDICQKH